jgi:hypothetical protein
MIPVENQAIMGVESKIFPGKWVSLQKWNSLSAQPVISSPRVVIPVAFQEGKCAQLCVFRINKE